MVIASLVVRVMPQHISELKRELAKVPGVEVQHEAAETGHLIVTVEDGEGYAVSDSIVAVSIAPNVQGVTLAYEYTDEGLECKEA